MAAKRKHNSFNDKGQNHGDQAIVAAVNAKASNQPAGLTNVKTGRFLLFILLAAFLAFLPVLNAEFVAWDDGVYVYDNPLVKDLSRLDELLTTPVAGGNHHPLTMLSLALNYQVSGEEAWSYHLLNLILHLINCVLVFRLSMLLAKGNTFIAFTTAILFAVHPMHVESVAWVSERKDVLYGMFFLAGLISYTRYVDTGSRKYYRAALLFLCLSLLSKPAAVIFPVVLYCVDFLRARKLDGKIFTEKILFFIPAIAMGVLTYISQKEAGATSENIFGLGSRILFGFYGIMMYFFKLFVPFNLAPVYPFPRAGQGLPFIYYAGPLFFVAFAILFAYSIKRYRVIAFGILFYLVNLLLVLQMLQVGLSVISDRYTYIPYIGLFFALAWTIDHFTKGIASKGYYIVVPFVFFLGILTYRQSSVWTSSNTLWEHAINSVPSTVAYTGKAMLMNDEKKLDEAIYYYSEALKLDPDYHEAYIRRGDVYMDANKLDLAYQDYRAALLLKPGYHLALANMGGLMGKLGQYDSALFYLNRSISLNPDNKMAYRNRAITHTNLNLNEQAVADFKKYLQYDPANADIYNAMGSCYRSLGRHAESIKAISRAIEITTSPAFFLNRSYSNNAAGKVMEARADALAARQAGMQVPPDYARLIGAE
jgi:tetratricopeptide (TPR) repeat protein